MFDAALVVPPQQHRRGAADARLLAMAAGWKRAGERRAPTEPVDLLGRAPGPVLAAAVEDVDLASVDDDTVVRVIEACERLASWVQAVQIAATGELASRELVGLGGVLVDGEEWAPCEIAAALSITLTAGEHRVEQALALVRQLPATLQALRAGRIDVARMRVLVDELAGVPDLDPQVRAEVEARVLARAEGRTGPQLRGVARRALQRAHPQAAQQRHAKRRLERRVLVRPLPDGMGEFTAILTADGLMTVSTALDAMADASGDPPDTRPAERRTTDQRRADTLVAVFRSFLDGEVPWGTEHQPACTAAAARPDVSAAPAGSATPPPGKRHGRRPHLDVTIPLSTLLAIDEAGGELAGYGPIPADLARAIAATARQVRILTTTDDTDDTGTCRHLGATRAYRPAPRLAAYLIARDRTCRFPGCRRQAARCDLDHTIPWPTGPTCHCNLAALCRRHHRMKHEYGWRLEWIGDPALDGDATLQWTSPLGRRYRTEPPAAELCGGGP